MYVGCGVGLGVGCAFLQWFRKGFLGHTFVGVAAGMSQQLSIAGGVLPRMCVCECHALLWWPLMSGFKHGGCKA